MQGAARTITAVARRLIAAERPGRFVLVASGLGKTARPGLAVYTASKAAVLAGIDPEVFRREHAVARIPAGRFGRPEEIADAVAHLVSDGASCITGATLNVAGGSEVH